MVTIKTTAYPDENGEIEICTTDSYTGEGTEEMRIDINTAYCSAWIHITEDEARQLRKVLDDWIDD